ncbi:MAG: DNA helicase [Chloroflexota bacterium]|nr:ATP-dependent helicase [Ardenticatenaceae bacterium]GIK55129.1 MAG: DNA helicase [Chloroflexota bacterium]
MNLRPPQARILEYQHGRMAISAVPGSGKTFTLSLLAAQIIADGRVNPNAGQQVLIVTYLNSSVDTFRARIRQRLDEMGRPAVGFDVRTLHSLANEIVKIANSDFGSDASLTVAGDSQARHFLNQAIDQWIDQYPDLWRAFLPDDSPQTRARWRDETGKMAQSFISAAKNERYRPEVILERLEIGDWRLDELSNLQSPISQSPLLHMLASIYGRYQTILSRQGALDFDDLIWQAADLLHHRAGLVETLRTRWPYVLEDEAQDSIPLQEILLETLTGPDGNWVRVGDPNQAITSTFTAAHPRFFNDFIDRPDVLALPLPNSGRSAPFIIGAANTMLDWVIDKHPVPEVRAHTFRRQHIEPTPPGDAQPNPPDSQADIRITVYRHREDEELPGVAQKALSHVRQHPDHTVAILVPTNNLGYLMAEQLDELDADYDNLLRGGTREREIAAAMHAVLAILADPLDLRAMVSAHASLHKLGHPAALLPEERLAQFHTLLKSVHQPERLLFPWEAGDVAAALPAGVATPEDLLAMERFAEFVGRLFDLRPLPINDLTLALGDELFAWGEIHEGDLSIAYQIATFLRNRRDAQPELRLPELAAELGEVAAGRRSFPIASQADMGYEPQPGRIALSTQHSAKGLEWDVVFMVGVDGNWIPGSLDAYFMGVSDLLGGDPTAEAVAQLRYLMAGDAGIYHGRTATESAHIDIISERLRLLYVGITRARRILHISRSRATRSYNKEREAEPATVTAVLYHYLKATRG